MQRFSTSILILILFVSVYVLCICAYTFISGLNSINYFDKRLQSTYDAFSRVRRASPANSSFSTNITFNVCCDRGEYLNSKFECVKVNGTNGSDVEDKVRFLLDTAVVDENFIKSAIDPKRIVLKHQFEYCPKDEMTAIRWSQQIPYTHYIDEENGYLLQLSEDRKTVVANYSTSSFCLDTTREEKSYLAIVCPCKDKLCVQKCCPKDLYYDIANGSCSKGEEVDLEMHRSLFPEGNSYHLFYSTPKCDGPDRMFTDENESLPLDIWENGNLMTLTKDLGVDRKKYCIDVFAHGGNNGTYLNGFYCPTAIKPFDTRNVEPQRIISEKGNSANIRNFANFELLTILTLIFCFALRKPLSFV